VSPQLTWRSARRVRWAQHCTLEHACWVCVPRLLCSARQAVWCRRPPTVCGPPTCMLPSWDHVTQHPVNKGCRSLQLFCAWPWLVTWVTRPRLPHGCLKTMSLAHALVSGGSQHTQGCASCTMVLVVSMGHRSCPCGIPLAKFATMSCRFAVHRGLGVWQGFFEVGGGRQMVYHTYVPAEFSPSHRPHLNPVMTLVYKLLCRAGAPENVQNSVGRMNAAFPCVWNGSCR
jgi:hypothetical protein